MDPDPTPYDEAFFAAIHAESHASARAVIPRVLGLTGARSVVDVGCGTGAWSWACRELGVPQVVGVDGAYVPAEHRGHVTEFIERDLAGPLDLGRSFALALCLEVAEHLPPERPPGSSPTSPRWPRWCSSPRRSRARAGPATSTSSGPSTGWRCSTPRAGAAATPSGRGCGPTPTWPGGTARTSSWRWARRSSRRTRRSRGWPPSRPEHPVDYIVRPVGDVMTPPAPPVPEPEPVAEPEPEPVPEPPTDHEPDTWEVPEVPEVPGVPAATNGEAAAGAQEHGPPDEDLLFPQPPGWAALRRIADRARRRSGR